MTTEAELAALRRRIANVLTGPACASIDFTIRGVRIRGGGYMVIGASLDVPHAAARPPAGRRPMSVRVDTRLPAGVGASYHAGPNAIVVPRADYGSGARECRALVHEATHAVFDYYRTRLDAWHEEAAAYIAGAIYFRYVLGAPLAGDIFIAADALAGRILAPQRLGGPSNRIVTPADADALIAVIRASPTYAGLREERRGYRYRHDGGGI